LFVCYGGKKEEGRRKEGRKERKKEGREERKQGRKGEGRKEGRNIDMYHSLLEALYLREQSILSGQPVIRHQLPGHILNIISITYKIYILKSSNI
jgi:hypothetical protein